MKSCYWIVLDYVKIMQRKYICFSSFLPNLLMSNLSIPRCLFISIEILWRINWHVSCIISEHVFDSFDNTRKIFNIQNVIHLDELTQNEDDLKNICHEACTINWFTILLCNRSREYTFIQILLWTNCLFLQILTFWKHLIWLFQTPCLD